MRTGTPFGLVAMVLAAMLSTPAGGLAGAANLSNSAPTGFTSLDLYASFSASGDPAPVDDGAYPAATETVDISPSGDRVIEWSSNNRYQGGATGSGIYAVTPGLHSTPTTLVQSAPDSYIKGATLLANGTKWATTVPQAKDPSSNPYGGSIEIGSFGGATRFISPPANVLLRDQAVRFSPGGNYFLASARVDQSLDSDWWVEMDANTGAQVMLSSADRLSTQAPLLVFPIQVDDKGRIFGWVRSQGQTTNSLQYYLPADNTWNLIGGLPQSLSNAPSSGIGDIALSDETQSLAGIDTATGTIVTYGLSTSDGNHLTVTSGSRRTSGVPQGVSVGELPQLWVSNDGQRVAANSGYGNGGSWFGTADTAGGSAHLFAPGGQLFDPNRSAGVFQWRGDLRTAVYGDNAGFVRVAHPFGGTEPTPSSNAPVATGTQGAVCHPVAVLAFRGSGEKNLEPRATSAAGATKIYSIATKTNGWEGPTLSRLIAAWADLTKLAPAVVSRTPVIGVGPAVDKSGGYRAVEASDLLHLNRSAVKGALYGSTLMDAFRASQPRPCATKFILFGYSQGAMAARDLALMRPADIAGVFNVGDPYQLHNALGVTGSGRGGSGIFRKEQPDRSRLARTLDSFYAKPFYKRSICHAHDPFCDFNTVLWIQPILSHSVFRHTTYYSPGEAEESARLLRNLISSKVK